MSEYHPDTTAARVGTVTVVGHGHARQTPDLLRFVVTVETRASKVALAYERAGQRMAAVLAALRSDGVSDADIGTTGLSVRTETVWSQDGGTRITGYVASSALTVTLRESSGGAARPDPAAIIAHCVEAGGDDVRLGGLTFTFADEEALLARARDAAWDSARAKAEQYAHRAGRRLGPVLEITENTASAPPTVTPVARTLAAPAGPEAVPVESGEGELSATIRVTWQLD
ncbi:SIMPL domain-containing protein [Nocardia paucivorans]|uniref:SIMPL domain-containing protein n=1 Tax=Nocardia paucivorans TaxID=114259 RepID=UPI0002EAFEDA|nr:SIMPL domain-containing protein [Nocardia paucivorans]